MRITPKIKEVIEANADLKALIKGISIDQTDFNDVKPHLIISEDGGMVIQTTYQNTRESEVNITIVSDTMANSNTIESLLLELFSKKAIPDKNIIRCEITGIDRYLNDRLWVTEIEISVDWE